MPTEYALSRPPRPCTDGSHRYVPDNMGSGEKPGCIDRGGILTWYSHCERCGVQRMSWSNANSGAGGSCWARETAGIGP